MRVYNVTSGLSSPLHVRSLGPTDHQFASEEFFIVKLVDGTSSLNQTNLHIINQSITNWAPGAALWLVWQMADATGKAQGLAIDNLSFSAVSQSVTEPPLSFQTTATNLVLSWTGVVGETYQVQYKDDLRAASWTPLGNPITGTRGPLNATNSLNQAIQRFYRLEILP